MKKNIKIAYSEPEDYFPEETRRKYKLGEFAEPKYEKLTKYLPTLINFKKEDQYSCFEVEFTKGVYEFIDENAELALKNYREILRKNGIEWGFESMTGADVSKMDAQCVLALIVGAIRADRFCDGALFEFYKNGSVERWIIRLEALDN